MANDRESKKGEYIKSPDRLLYKVPFRRGIDNRSMYNSSDGQAFSYNEKKQVSIPKIRYKTVTQDTFMRELDPMCHDVLFDSNIPSICRKLDNGSYEAIEYSKMALSIQRNIRDKHTLHLCANPMKFTLLDTRPTKKQSNNFIVFKQYWNARNQDGMRYKMVETQKGLGDAGLLYYFDYKGRIKSRILSYPDYVLLPINDNNGDRMLEAVYYEDGERQRIDCYDDTYLYRFINGMGEQENGWVIEGDPIKHGFSEIPLITKRGEVAWNNIQSIIETYEIVYNIYNVIQKRQGWGILFIKGNTTKNEIFNGSLVIKAVGLDVDKSEVEYKTPPTGDGMKQSLDLLSEQIQKGAGFTQMLPKDVTSMGDISGVAIQFSMSLDNQTALQGVIDWQNVADKMTRLFKEGLAKELVSNGTNPTAITDFENLNIGAKFTVWMPKSALEYNNMIVASKQANVISGETATELCELSQADEKVRREIEEAKEMEKQQKESINEVNNDVEQTKTEEEV